MRKIQYAIVITTALILFLSGLDVGLKHASYAKAEIGADEKFDENMRLMTEIISRIESEYVDVDKTDVSKLFEGAIQGMLSQLDPHSQWMPKRDYQDFQVETKGSFGGLGIRIDIEDSWLTVVQPLEDTPASRAGIRAGDKIVEIDGKTTQGITVDQAVDQLRGPEGSEVVIKIVRRVRENRNSPWKPERKTYTLVRDKIRVTSIPPSGKKMLADGIAYVRLEDFKQEAGNELEAAIKELSANQELKGVILDLRYNQGGLLDVAIQVSDIFLPEDKTIVSIRDRKGLNGGREEVRRSRSADSVKCPVAVLVNHWSASASEIVAGALQDHHRAVVIAPKGVKTYGKGSVQTVHPLRDGSGLKLTTAKYYTPSGRSIHGTGLTPDVEVDVDEDHEYEVVRLRRMGVPPADYLPKPDKAEIKDATAAEISDATGESDKSKDTDPDKVEGSDTPNDETKEGVRQNPGEPSEDDLFRAGDLTAKTEEDQDTWDTVVARAVDVIRSYRILSQVDTIQ